MIAGAVLALGAALCGSAYLVGGGLSVVVASAAYLVGVLVGNVVALGEDH